MNVRAAFSAQETTSVSPYHYLPLYELKQFTSATPLPAMNDACIQLQEAITWENQDTKMSTLILYRI